MTDFLTTRLLDNLIDNQTFSLCLYFVTQSSRKCQCTYCSSAEHVNKISHLLPVCQSTVGKAIGQLILLLDSRNFPAPNRSKWWTRKRLPYVLRTVFRRQSQKRTESMTMTFLNAWPCLPVAHKRPAEEVWQCSCISLNTSNRLLWRLLLPSLVVLSVPAYTRDWQTNCLALLLQLAAGQISLVLYLAAGFRLTNKVWQRNTLDEGWPLDCTSYVPAWHNWHDLAYQKRTSIYSLESEIGYASYRLCKIDSYRLTAAI